MLETVSVFDAMELDNTHQRVSSRRALALAHNRVERNLGSFLRGAKNEDEFFERLALVQEDFTGYVTTAAAEVGHEHPEHIAESLRDHYRQAAQPVQFQETPEEKLEEEKEEAEEKTSAVQIAPKKAKKALKRMAKAGRTWTNAKASEGKQGSPLAESYNPGTQQDPAKGKVTCPECGGSGKTAGNSSCRKCGGNGKVENFGDPIAQAYTSRTAELTNDPPYHTGAENQNNTDLDGPEPKMDKSEWTRTNPGQPDYQDGSRHPTEQKDMTEVIGPMHNYENHNDIDEIHGQGTHFKNETLPSNSGDAGFDGGGPGPAPHTDTFGNDGQVNPVTDQSLEAVQSNANPLSELLMAEWPSEQVVTAALLQP